MKSMQKCDICGFFKSVGFTDCGLICEECFNKEIQINAFNQGVEKSAKYIEGDIVCLPNLAIEIRKLKMKDHVKVD